MARGKFIDLTGEGTKSQERLFAVPGTKKSLIQPHPDVEQTEDALNVILASPAAEKGIDFEFEHGWKDVGGRMDVRFRPTIVSICTDDRIACVKWTPEIGRKIALEIRDGGARWVAHSGVTADKPVNDEVTGIVSSMDKWEDSMMSHFLMNQHLTKAPSKDGDDDGALGFMNLWAAASLTTDLYNWKSCRGHACEGPCPSHRPMEYCAVDTWAGLKCHQFYQARLSENPKRQTLYRELLELTDLCWQMERQGVKINTEYVKIMDADADLRKEALFPFEVVGKKKQYAEFNPRATPQVVEWFQAHGIRLNSNNKGDVRKVLERELGLAGFNSLKEMEDSEDDLPSALDALYRLDQFKSEGKGLDSWFGPKYVDRFGYVHPRFVTVGTSTGRLSSAGPNFQNVPARGFGDLVRRALVARSSGLTLVKSDFKQLELRMCVVPETKILTTDLRWIRADEVKVGDELIGFDEKQQNGHTGVRYRRSNVLACGTVRKKTVTLNTDKESITGADDHYLVVMRPNRKGSLTRKWVMLKDIAVGDKLPFICRPWEEDKSREGGYLAGIFDGEGWLSAVGIGFAQAQGDVERYTKKLLDARGYRIGSWIAKKQPQYTKPHVKALITCGMWETLRFLGTIRPLRLLQKNAISWEGRRAWGGINTVYATVVSLEMGSEQNLCAITTSTKTYMANGFFSHNCLYCAGIDQSIISQDAFYWLVDQAGGLFERAAELVDPKGYTKDPRKAARNIAKRISHAGDYLEGFKLLDPYELDLTSTKRLIDAGALKVYAKKYMPGLEKDWIFLGKYVAFTGSNLSDALFGNHTNENRKKALEIQEDIYFKKFHAIRTWHRKVLEEVERTGCITSPTGRFLRLYGRDEDKAKVAVAFLGQGVSADHVQAVMLRYKREFGVVPLLQVHDELVFERDRSLSDDEHRKFISVMCEPTWRLDGFSAPCEAKIGDNWKDMRVFFGE